jgi:hypothetical protein
MNRILGTTLGLFVLVGTSDVATQSLADVARKEEARRKTIKRPMRVYTNADAEARRPLTTAAARPQAAPATQPPSSSTSSDHEPGHGAAPGETPTKPDAGSGQPKEQGSSTGSAQTRNDEASWRARLQKAQDLLSRSETALQSAQREAAAQSLALGPSGSVANQAADMNAKYQAVVKEIERLRNEVVKHTYAVAEVHEQARREGIPPGWLR